MNNDPSRNFKLYFIRFSGSAMFCWVRREKLFPVTRKTPNLIIIVYESAFSSFFRRISISHISVWLHLCKKSKSQLALNKVCEKSNWFIKRKLLIHKNSTKLPNFGISKGNALCLFGVFWRNPILPGFNSAPNCYYKGVLPIL